MFDQLRDAVKVVAVAGTNLVAAVAASIIPGATPRVAENFFLHDSLTVVQILVGVLTGAYVALKLYRAIFKPKRPDVDPEI